MALIDAAGALVSQHTYQPFGATTILGSTANSIRFTGRENDGTGLYYYRARYYSPVIGLFVSEDPIGFQGDDVNLYVYVGNIPTGFTDPMGQLSWPLKGKCEKAVKDGVRDSRKLMDSSECPKELEKCRDELRRLPDLDKMVNQFADYFCDELSLGEGNELRGGKATPKRIREILDRIREVRKTKGKPLPPFPESCL